MKKEKQRKKDGKSPTRVFYPMSDGGGGFRVSYVSFDPRSSTEDSHRRTEEREDREGRGKSRSKEGWEKEGEKKEKGGKLSKESKERAEEAKGRTKRKVYRVRSRRDVRIRRR